MKKIDLAPEQIFCPQPMYAIGTNNEVGAPNFCVITWIEFNWHGGPHIVLGVGGSKRTKENILRTGTFSANLVSVEMLWLADYFGCSRAATAPKIRCPTLGSAATRWTCRCWTAAPGCSSARWIV